MILKWIIIPVSSILLLFSFKQRETAEGVIQRGAKLEKLADGFLFTEGPASDSTGNVYFTDQPNNRIMVWSITGELNTFIQPSGRSNGLFFDKKGILWCCADERNELWQISADTNVKVLPLKYQERNLNGPNDLWITSKGGVYFTDPFYKRSWWSHSVMPQDCQAVYYLSPDHKTVTRVIADLIQPNGIVGTPDGTILYVADIGDGKTWSYGIESDGTLTEKTLFCEMGSDGMTLDAEGNVYLTGKGVTIFNKNGRKIGAIDVPENWTANVCFGDKDRKSLFITASKSLYRIRTCTEGAD